MRLILIQYTDSATDTHWWHDGQYIADHRRSLHSAKLFIFYQSRWACIALYDVCPSCISLAASAIANEHLWSCIQIMPVWYHPCTNILIYWTSSAYVITYRSYILLKWSFFGPPCRFTGLVQIIFNRDEIQDNNVASYKMLNIFIYDPSFYVIIFMSYKLLKIIPFLPTLYYGYFLTDLNIDLKSEIHFKSRFSTFKKHGKWYYYYYDCLFIFVFVTTRFMVNKVIYITLIYAISRNRAVDRSTPFGGHFEFRSCRPPGGRPNL